MSKFRVLLVSTNADLAGAPCHVRDLALGLRAEGHEVAVAFGSEGEIKSELYCLGVKVYDVQGMRSSMNPLRDRGAYRGLLAVARDFRPSFIHCHSAKASMLSRLVARRLGLPCVYTVHGWGFGPGRKWQVAFILKWIEKLLVPVTSHYIAVSQLVRDTGIAELGIEAGRITTILNGVRFKASPPENRPIEPRVIMVARNEFPKDYDTLSRALGMIAPCSAVYVGHGTSDAAFVAKSLAYGLSANAVAFLGARTDIQSLLEDASIFVLSTGYEALPLSIIEAMSKGLPVIAADVGSVRDLVKHGVNGFLFEPGNHRQLAHYLGILIDSPALRVTMGAESFRSFVADFSSEQMVRRVIDVYKTLGVWDF
jgi:glycosyltransferase involved in cell wall biosynthesis